MPVTPELDRRLHLLPWIVGLSIAAFALASWAVLNKQENARMIELTDVVADRAEKLIRGDLNQRINSLQRLADRWQFDAGTERSKWEADAGHYIADHPGYQAIEWADRTFRVRWIMPLEGNLAARDLDITSLPVALSTAEKARAQRSVALTPPIKLAQGHTGLVAYLPVFLNDEFGGLIIGVFSLQTWLQTVLMQDEMAPYHISISINDDIVHRPNKNTPDKTDARITEKSFSFYGLNWVVTAQPAEHYLSAIHSRSSNIILIFGLLMSALVGWVIHTAISARQQARKLSFNSRRLSTLLSNSPGMVYRCINQPSWPIVFVSEACLELSGYSKSELEQQQVLWNDLIHIDDRERIWRSVQDAIANNEAHEDEYRIITRQGDEKWVWERGRLIETQDEEAVYLEGMITDITNQKRVQAALILAEANAKVIVDTAAEAIITISSEGQIETFNKAAQQMFGYDLSEITGQNIGVLMPEPYHSEHHKYLSRYVDTGQSRIIGKRKDVFGLHKDGTVFPIQLSVSEVVNEGEQKFVGLIRDLSEQYAAEQEAKEHRDRLAHVDRLIILGEMATGIAHEINQPLTAISMYAQASIRLLDSGNSTPQKLHNALEKLSTQAHRAGSIIERMQRLAKQRDSMREFVDCNALMREVHKLAETQAQIRDMDIELDLSDADCRVMGDPVQIQQVALNLLSNGMESMENSGARQSNRIILRTRVSVEGFVISVIDKGTGVSDEVAERLYEPFSSTKKTGMGMGLSICKSIISAHGGQIGFHNNDEGGTTFYFVLPCETTGDL